MQSLAISSLYVPLFGIMLCIITLRVGQYRAKTGLSFGDGGDAAFNRKIRAQANFTETTPMALLLIVLVEFQGGSSSLVHGLFLALLIGRISHYLQLTSVLKPVLFRMMGMILTLSAILIPAGWLLVS